MYEAKIIDRTEDAAGTYMASQDIETITLAVSQGKVQTLETILTPTFTFAEMPEHVKNILNNSDSNIKAIEEEDNDEYTVYRLEKKGQRIFKLTIYKDNGNYKLERYQNDA